MAKEPQQQFFTTQDIVAPDINILYNKIIKDIDSYRSYFNVLNSGIEQSIALDKFDGIFTNNDSNSVNRQESRCNAFFRMIGFPIVSPSSNQFYSPGFDPDLNRDPDKLKKQITIANAILNDNTLRNILNQREVYPQNSINVFENKDDNSTARALYSLVIKPFDQQFSDSIEPLKADKQQITVSGRNFVNSEFINEENITVSTTVTHVLKPFIVDPRIDFTVMPAANRICAPFLLDKSKSQITKNTRLKRPYIEKVIRVRFSTSNVVAPPSDQPEINKTVDDILKRIQQQDTITNSSLVEISANPLKFLHRSEVIVFAKFIKIIESLVNELAISIVGIDKIRSQINWHPFPKKGGPEFGSTLNAVNPNDTLNNKSIESQISDVQTQKILSETDFDIGTNKSDLGNFSFSGIDDIIFGSIKSVPHFYDKQLNQLTRYREELGAKANDLLRRVEIITGEFSGLGLLDVMAIQAALWVIEPKTLIGMVDDQSIERLKADKELAAQLTLPSSRSEATTALGEFEKKIKEIYKLIGGFYKTALESNGKNRQ